MLVRILGTSGERLATQPTHNRSGQAESSMHKRGFSYAANDANVHNTAVGSATF